MRLSWDMLVVVVVAGGLVAACGSVAQPAASPPSVSVSMSHSEQVPASSADAGSPVSTTTVDIANFAFAPAVATVRVGSTITWTNKDQEPHTVTSKDGSGTLRSPSLNTGESFKYTFTKPGRYDYLCTIHPFMTATVVVTA
jgi:amicyanin